MYFSVVSVTKVVLFHCVAPSYLCVSDRAL